MIEFRGVTKNYRANGVDKCILDDITIEFPMDRNIGILGHNGTGKSTLMRLIAGAELPTQGRIHRHVETSWPLGFAGGFNGTMTGMENIRFVSRMYGQDADEMIAFVDDFSELGPSLKAPIETYSSGMRARLAFGISMAVNFDCYLIDEITAVGDRRFKSKCAEVFAEKLKTSKIIMVSHSSLTLKKFCDAGCILHKGKLTYYDDLEEAMEIHDQNQLKSSF